MYKDAIMSRPILLALTLTLFSSASWSAALDKYAPPSAAQQVAPYPNAPQQAEPQQKSRSELISAKQRQALETLRALPPQTQQQWIDEFRAKAAKAAEAGRYGEAAYYQGIIEAWELENQ